MKIIRKILGPILLFGDAITRPRQIKRTEQERGKLDLKTQNLQLFEFRTCPFCVKVRRNIHRLNLRIKIRDARNEPDTAQELIAGGGKRQVPCLRIEEGKDVQWMYESNEINAYLNKNFETVS